MPICSKKSNIWMTDMAFSSHWHLGNRSLGTTWSADVIVIPCMQRLHQFYQLEPKGVARGRELIKTDAAFACMVQLINS